ncbi:MAG: DUF3035 domain-containing protein [Pseudorhodobacter sp.]|nr:DUF3035 domain-containing protein [Pseudorhodobacter sp.]
MQAGRSALAIAGLAMLTLAACGEDVPQLMNLRATGNGPDEFAIVPPKGLEMPEDLASLPEPTPNGTNRTDQTPEDDAVAALGGRPGAARGVPAGDSGLVNYSSRYGRAAEIRTSLAAEDLEYRRNNKGKFLERLFNVTTYFQAYEPISLDQHAELERWRRAGVRTVAAPPPGQGQ